MSQRTSIMHPVTGSGAVRVVVEEGPPPAVRSPGVWRNDCEVVPRLGEDEPRRTWVQRIATFIEDTPARLASVSYPLGPDAHVALVCFAAPADG